MKKICIQYDIPIKQFSGEALNKLLSHSWPGNVRELENTIERAITLCESRLIYPEHINLISYRKSNTMKSQLQEEEQRIIKETLARYRGDKLSAIKELDISKSAFYEKCKKYNIQL